MAGIFFYIIDRPASDVPVVFYLLRKRMTILRTIVSTIESSIEVANGMKQVMVCPWMRISPGSLPIGNPVLLNR